MNPGTDIVKELEELNSPLAQMPRVTPFQVPEHYFQNFTDELVAAAITDDAEPILNLPAGAAPYAVPQGYFEGFAASLMDKLAETPDFGNIPAPAFEVPAGYFEQLPQQVMAAAKAADHELKTVAAPQKKAKTISLMPRRVAQWAAAACLLVAVGLGGYKMIGGAQPLSPEKQLAQLDKDEIKSYIDHHIDEFDTEMLAESSPVLNAKPEKSIRKLDKAAIEDYLDEGGI